MGEVRFSVDDRGMLRCVNGRGEELYPPSPLVRWERSGSGDRLSAPEPQCLDAGQGGCRLRLSPEGLECTASRIDPGRYGESRFELELRNLGPTALRGNPMPVLTEWLGPGSGGRHGGIAADRADGRYFALSRFQAHRGSGDPVFAWPPTEFVRDVFAVVPASAPDERIYLTCSLLHGSGGSFGRLPGDPMELPAGQTARCVLHLDSGAGGFPEALRETYRVRGGYRVDPAAYSFSRYRDPKLRWVTEQVVTWLNWAWDREVMDPVTGEYRLIEALERARGRFWGFDAYELWPFWPRAGFDERMQFDHFRRMPGGTRALRELAARARELGVRTVVSYYVWCETDRGDSEEDLRRSYRELVELAVEMEADGVLMDIMSTTPEEIREYARSLGHDLAPYNEWDPGWEESQENLTGRIHNSVPMPRFNLKRYMLPHHPILRVCEPGNEGKVMRNDLVLSFFSGHGVEINTMFPQDNPDCREEWDILARAVDILRTNRDCFASPDWEPFTPTEQPAVWANRWPAPGKTLYTLCGTDPGGTAGALLRLPKRTDVHYVDLWRYRPLDAEEQDQHVVLSCDIEGYRPGRGMARGSGDYSAGCIAVLPRLLDLRLDFEMLVISVAGPEEGWTVEVWERDVRPAGRPVVLRAADRLEVDLYGELGRHTNEAIVVRLLDGRRQLLDAAVAEESLIRFFRIDKPGRTETVSDAAAPEGMVRIPGGAFDYTVTQTQAVWQATYTNMWNVYQPAAPSWSRRVVLAPFWMDRFPVTNADYAAFLAESGYRPREAAGFLASFTNGQPPAGKENHPVVHVSCHDATAYAEWAGKRLPTEEEWQLAAGGAAGRPWPWGEEEPREDLCVVGGRGTEPVDAHPAGASPYGVEDLVGNVWQFTASMMDNGRHTIVFLRGGGWYRSPEGMWWVRGGPRPITDHFPLPLFGPAMNRLSTVGFRCVKDA